LRTPTRTPAVLEGVGSRQFVAIASMIMAMGALAVDLMLPAFAGMREDFGLAPDSTAVGATVTAFLLGLSIAQIVYGPFADRFGRKPVLYVAFGIYAVSAVVSALAPSLTLLLVARFVWGLGAAGGRVIAVAMVRDVYEGDGMARAMSFVMAVFILVPIIAPTVGAAVVAVADWRWVFGVPAVFIGLLALWTLRLPETQHPSDRMSLRFDRIRLAATEVVRHRTTIGYTIGLTALFAAFVSYLASSEIIVGEVFGRPGLFPVLFGTIASVMGVAMLTNARIVERIGARRLVRRVLLGYLATAGAVLGLALATGGTPPLVVYAVGLAANLGAHALLIPNINSVAMEPMGHIAGTASAVIGSISTLGGTLIGAAIDRTFNGTVTPLAIAFVCAGLVCLAATTWAERTPDLVPEPDPATP
jgi:DHA1 family bicyclomycin/chloramphenicol resistance-like MFS transporter